MTSPIALLEARLTAAEAKIVLFEDMIDTSRRVVAAQKFKVETGEPSPHLIEVTDGGSLCLGSEGYMRVIGSITEGASHTGDTDETVLGEIELPADSMGPNGIVRITALWRWLGAGNHTIRIKFGSLIVKEFTGAGANTKVDELPTFVWNRGDPTSQASGILLGITHGRAGEAQLEGTEDTTAAVAIQLTAQNAAAGLLTYLDLAMVEAFCRD